MKTAYFQAPDEIFDDPRPEESSRNSMFYRAVWLR